ncbi:MAG: M67 family metallopeptidase [Nitrospirae bacterium]|nr:M67 family metallopeptidase [Nitrospirota bacterium]
MTKRILRIPQSIICEMWKHGLEEYPNECCGLLAGRGNEVERFYRVENKLKSPTRFLMEPRDQLRAFKEMDKAGIELQVIYHSHTRSPAYPSGTDLELAVFPEVNYLLMSFQWVLPQQRDPFPDTQVYWITNGSITPARADIV